jgi:N utilization substance protein A
VPEIQDDIVEIMAIAREPGARTKVAVTSKRPEIDAVGACLGPKSSRIANVSDELRGEKIDVIRWAADLPTFVANALAPAKVLGVELYEEEGIALVVVPDHQLSLAIGREGQNVRLAGRLTGWRMDITSDSEAAEARERYVAEREARAAQAGVEEAEPAEDEAVEGEEADEAAIDQDELLRRLEEFKREMFTKE